MDNVDQIIVTINDTLKESLERLNNSGTSILLLVDVNNSLQRTITDGDIRRLLLAGKGLGDTLESLEEKVPVVGFIDASNTEILGLMDRYEINQIPIVDANNCPVGLHLRHKIQPRILLSVPHMGGYERQFVDEAFQTNWIAPLGPNVDAFEKDLADYVGSQHAAALNSGTAAIHLALRLLDVTQGDLVLCSSFTFVASANPILYQGATPIFIDSEPATWNMSPVALEKALQECCQQGKKPKAIIVVHLYGQSASMEEIMAISEVYGVPVVEDAAESMGASYRGQHTGTFGVFGVFSFNGNKIITTSGGGMLVSNDAELIEKARFLSTQAKDSVAHYEHSEVGYNYRMSNVLAGIGRGQLKVLSERVKSRRNVFFRYRDAFVHLECIDWMPEPEGDFSNRWLSSFSLNPRKTEITPQMLIDALAELNIEARPVWKPMHLQPLFKGSRYFRHDEEQSYCDYLFKTSICLPSASSMSVAQQNSVIDCILDVFK
jgi:dTDP-4-amino-4,6-dideoxygalactose transaminase